MKGFISFIKDESGQTSTEYILLVVVGAMLVFKFSGVAKDRLMALTGSVFDEADKFIGEIRSQ